MTDVEEAEKQNFLESKGKKASTSLPSRHPINIMYRTSVISGSLYGMHSMSVFHNVMRSPHVDHSWFKIGLAASIAVSMIKAYMELYETKVRKQKVEYANYKNATHAVMILILVASFAFHKSLWGAYGGLKTMLIMFLFGWGILLQLCLLLRPWLQNLVAFVGLTFLLQQYQ
jgi:hypothetical protein